MKTTLKNLLMLGLVGSLISSVTSQAAFATSKRQAPRSANKTAVEIGELEAEGGFSNRFEDTSALPWSSSSEMVEMNEPDGTTVILPPGYDAGRSYPALVLMPYTDRSALHMFNWGIYDTYHQRNENAFVIIMPPGQGSSANWSGSGWESFVGTYETYIQQDLDPIAAKYSVDPNQMVIGGFSLGGDLSWTLSLRNPGLFSGAIVMGSMSNYRNEQNAQLLADRDFRYFMVMGGYDDNRGSMHNALGTLDTHRIDYHYEEVGNAGHGDLPEQMQNDLFLSAMDYILSENVASLLRE